MSVSVTLKKILLFSLVPKAVCSLRESVVIYLASAKSKLLRVSNRRVVFTILFITIKKSSVVFAGNFVTRIFVISECQLPFCY